MTKNTSSDNDNVEVMTTAATEQDGSGGLALPDMLKATMSQKVTRRELIEILVSNLETGLEERRERIISEIIEIKERDNKDYKARVTAAKGKVLSTITDEDKARLDVLMSSVRAFYDEEKVQVSIYPALKIQSAPMADLTAEIFLSVKFGSAQHKDVWDVDNVFDVDYYNSFPTRIMAGSEELEELVKLRRNNIPWRLEFSTRDEKANDHSSYHGDNSTYREGRIVELFEEKYKVDQELYEFRNNTRKFKVQAMKKLLGMSEAGQRVLEVLETTARGSKKLVSKLDPGKEK